MMNRSLLCIFECKARKHEYADCRNTAARKVSLCGVGVEVGSQPAHATKSPGKTPETERTIDETPYSFVRSIPFGVIANAKAPMGISNAVYVTSSPTKRMVVQAMHIQSGICEGIPTKNKIITAAINHGARRI